MDAFDFEEFYKQFKQASASLSTPVSHSDLTSPSPSSVEIVATDTPNPLTSALASNSYTTTSIHVSIPNNTTISTSTRTTTNPSPSKPTNDIASLYHSDTLPNSHPHDKLSTLSPPLTSVLPTEGISLPVMFSDLTLKAELLLGMNKSGYTKCSPVQRECLPHALKGENIFCKASPGIGKTLVFVVTILQSLADMHEIQAVVLANTPELVSQIYDEFVKVGMYLKHMHLVSYHEHNSPENIRAANILIGTPYKVNFILKKLDISPRCIFVLDEADRVRYKEEELPKDKQVIMTATAHEPDTLAVFHKFVSSPSYWLSYKDEDLMPSSLQHTYQLVSNSKEKYAKLMAILDAIEFNQMIIFDFKVNHKPTVLRLVSFLREREFNVMEMSAERSFDDRMKDFVQFRKFKTRLMVSTDILSRGIDVKHVNIVLNFDMAQRSDTYLRRVGRAGRFGKKGLAISFLESSQDVVMRKEVEERFSLRFKTLSLQIEPHTYMNKVDEAELQNLC